MKKFFFQVLLLLALLVLIFLSFSTVMPMVKPSARVPANKFSVHRALAHVKEMTKEPHYTGSAYHSKVRNYIVDQLQGMGLTVHTQSGYVMNAAKVMTYAENIITKLPGSAPEPQSDLLLLAHYDSEPHSSYGASDDGVAVAAILEAVRVFMAKEEAHKNNLVIAFTDAEEIGLLGAQLLAEEHPWIENVGLVLNFEARGTRGPSNTILETNFGNANLIKAFAGAKPRFPVASSLMYEVYKRMPNDTDATVFREDLGIPSFFFAFIDGHYNYHTAEDNYAHVNDHSLAHQGAYLTDLLPYFGNADLSSFKTDENQVYFNFPFFKFIHYGYSWIYPLVLLAWVLFIGLLLLAIKKRKLQFKEVARGAFAYLMSLLFVGVLGWAGWKIILFVYPQYLEIQQGFPYNGHAYILAFTLMGFGIFLGCYRLWGKASSSFNLLLAPLFFWLLINTGLALAFKGASYFIFPALFLELAGMLLLWKERGIGFLLLILGVPALFIFSPLIAYVPVALGMKVLFGGLGIMVLMLGVLLPVIRILYASRWPAWFLVLGGLVFLVLAHFKSSFSVDNPRPNSLVYVLDKDTREAQWKSYDKSLDRWTARVIDTAKREISSPPIMPSKYGAGFWYEQETEAKDIPGAGVKVKQEVSEAGYTAYQLKIVPHRELNRLILFSLDKQATFKELTVNGIAARHSDKPSAMYTFSQEDKQHLLTYYPVNRDTLRIEFKLPLEQFSTLQLYGASYDLLDNPWLEVSPRAKEMIPRPFTLNDAIITVQEIELSNQKAIAPDQE